ncbi:efflux RND transporter periplasmic adaptor subunit [Marivirga harenae]|uniref:efflux RND transporter periplasmic adaptor subunit n=1 Tax=Marivirga harenae TaxID=2010992 RepID=UPI0026E0C9B3|nr:efflux RND transporter periplasmic adaptor subunit [Marivirga harenae]WKV12344.1 efflux RND transporter periplasmic adaptor subunit [Marivirga harenae]|tara:strand:- start:8720 stop:9778 length:1059 start_codon:yes stop_codon:yes gene_type:complete
MKKLLTWSTPLLLMTILWSCGNEESNIQTEIKIPVSVVSIKPASISRFIETTGTVYSSKEGTMKSEMSGLYRIQRNPATGKPFALGDAVKANQIVIRLENEEFVNGLQVEGKRLNLELAENNLEKQKSLYDKGGVTQTELKNASIQYVNAKYSFENAEIQLAKMAVRAPFDGVIVELPYHTDGVKIDQGTALFRVMEYDKLLMDVKLPEKHLPEVTLDQLVQITNYNIGNDTIEGRISQISPIVNPDTRTFQSVLQINNEKRSLRPGMFIKAAILSEKRDSTIVIPKETVISRQDAKVVFIVENGIATEKQITTGLETMDEIEVLSGLKINDRLVVTGFETLRNKSKVSVLQ